MSLSRAARELPPLLLLLLLLLLLGVAAAQLPVHCILRAARTGLLHNLLGAVPKLHGTRAATARGPVASHSHPPSPLPAFT